MWPGFALEPGQKIGVWAPYHYVATQYITRNVSDRGVQAAFLDWHSYVDRQPRGLIVPAAVTGQAVVDDTHRALAELRAVCPVSQIAPDTWFVTTPGEAFRVLDDVGSFSGLHDGGPPPAQRTLFQSTPEDHAIRAPHHGRGHLDGSGGARRSVCPPAGPTAWCRGSSSAERRADGRAGRAPHRRRRVPGDRHRARSTVPGSTSWWPP